MTGHKEILVKASKELEHLVGHNLDVLDIKKPHSIAYAQHLAKVISKISPLLGNMIEFSIIEKLNAISWKGAGKWVRQDPGFPDAVFVGKVFPQPGIEIKTWFPLATEITARFKDSINHFKYDQTNVAVVAWLPEFLIYGKPKIIDVWVGSGKSLAMARDGHYHNPPDYLVFEPEDTSNRTVNLQQTNTNGYKFQGTRKQFAAAQKEVEAWGKNHSNYSPLLKYQKQTRMLLGKYPYRLDTNFAKIDRIEHVELEKFKARVLATKIDGQEIRRWAKLFGNAEEDDLSKFVEELL